MPWDGVVELSSSAYSAGSAASVLTMSATIDGTAIHAISGTRQQVIAATVNTYGMLNQNRRKTLAAGKHRIALTYATSAGALTMDASSADLPFLITAFRGK